MNGTAGPELSVEDTTSSFIKMSRIFELQLAGGVGLRQIQLPVVAGKGEAGVAKGLQRLLRMSQ